MATKTSTRSNPTPVGPGRRLTTNSTMTTGGGGSRRKRISSASFVDVLMQRYGDGVDQFDDCPFEIFVLGGLSPHKSGNLKICFSF